MMGSMSIVTRTSFAGPRQLMLLTATFVSLYPCFIAEAQVNKRDQARLHFRQGMEYFEQEKYDEALKEYDKAYELLPLPGFLFNIGQCYRNQNQYQKAIDSFRLYLEKKPDANNRQAIEKLINELQIQIDADKNRNVQATNKNRNVQKAIPIYVPREHHSATPIGINAKPLPPPVPSKPLYKRWWFITGLALAIAGAATITYFAINPLPADLPTSNFSPANFRR